MKTVTLITVPHTGTKFTEDLFRQQGYIRYTLGDNPMNKSRVLFGGHLGTKDRYEAAIKAIWRGHPVVITMRHPYLVEKSWKGRNKPIPVMIEGFKQLDEIYRTHRPLVLPVDSLTRRDRCLEVMGTILDMDLSTKWRPLNISQGTYELKPEDIKPSGAVRELVEGMELMKFYESNES